MANPITQYFKDTRSELNHVAWPTQWQTVVYTILVAAISIGLAAYLGAFDYIFTAALTDLVGAEQNSSAALQVTQEPATSTASQSPAVGGPNFTIPGATTDTSTQ